MSSAKFSWSRSAFQNAAARASRQVPSQAAERCFAEELEQQEQRAVQAELPKRRTARLVVDAEHGAGIEVSFEPSKGFLLASVADTPGQPDLREGDIIVAAGGHSLMLAREEEADEVLANAISDGVELEVESPWVAAVESELPQTNPFLGVTNAAGAREEHETFTAPNPETLPSVSSFGGKWSLSGAQDSTVIPQAVECSEDARFDDAESGGSSDSEGVQFITRGLGRGLIADDCDEPHCVAASADATGSEQEQPAIASEGNEGLASSYECAREACWGSVPPQFDSSLDWNPDCVQTSSQLGAEVMEGGEQAVPEMLPDIVPLPSNLTVETSFEDVLATSSATAETTSESSETKVQQFGIEMDQPFPLSLATDDKPQENRTDGDELEVSTNKSTSVAALSSMLFAVGLPSNTASIDLLDDKKDEVGTPSVPLPQIPSTLLSSSRWPTEETPSAYAESCEDVEIPPQPRFIVSPQVPECVAVEPPERAAPLLKLEKVSLNEPSQPLNLEICLPGLHSAAAKCLVPGFSRNEMLVPDKGRCKVHELWDWLCELRLQEYHAEATTWCIEMGAANLEELAENIDDLIEALALKPIERQRVQKWAAQALMNGSCSYGWGIEAGLESHANTSTMVVDSRSLSSGLDHSSSSSAPIYTSRSVRLAMDSRGSTGLTLHWCDEWGILVEGVDPLPGQPGLKQGDFIVAIEGCSLRHRTHEECDAIFTERLQDGAILSIVTPTFQDSPKASSQLSHEWSETTNKGAPLVSLGKSGPHRFPRAPSQATGQLGWKLGLGKGGPRRGRTGGYDANSMWRRFRGPVW